MNLKSSGSRPRKELQVQKSHSVDRCDKYNIYIQQNEENYEFRKSKRIYILNPVVSTGFLSLALYFAFAEKITGGTA